MDLIVSVEDAVGRIVLNRPEAHNAINQKMWEKIPNVMQALKDQGARVIVFSGQGESFASGADLYELKKLKRYSQAKQLWTSISECLNSIASFSIPTIAEIRGACIGGGCLLALACDLRYASEDARFSIPVAMLGIVLDDETISRLVAIVGLSKAYEMLHLGNVLDAYQAKQISLVNDTVSLAVLEKTVSKAADKIVNNSAVTIEQSKSSIGRLLAVNNKKQNPKLVVNSYLSQEFMQRINQLTQK